MFYLLIFLLILPNITCMDYNVTQLDPNTSVYAEEIGTLQYYDSYWKVITNVNLSQYQLNVKEIKKKIIQMNRLCKVIKELTKVNHCTKFTSEIKAIEKSLLAKEFLIENFIQSKQQSRRKRSLFDGIGKIFKILFGTLNVDDAQFYDEQMSEMDMKQINTINLIQNQTSLVRSSIHIIQENFLNNDKSLQVLSNNFNKIENDFSKITNYTNLNNFELKIFEELQEFVIAIILESRLLQEEQTRLLDILLYSSQGKLHPYLIGPNQLDSLLKEIEIKLPHHLSIPTNNGIIDKHTIYEISTFDAIILGNNIIFKINLPLTLAHKYKITHLISLPVRVESKNIHVELQHEYIAISDNFITYALLKKEDIDKCYMTSNLYYCKLNKMLFNIHVHETCELTVKTKNKLDLCKSTEINPIDEIYIRLHQQNSYLYSLNNDVAVYVKCAQNSYNFIINHIGKISLSQGCIMQTPSLIMYGQTEIQMTQINHTILKFENVSYSHIKNNPLKTEQKLKPIILDDTRKLDVININLEKINQMETNLKKQHLHNVHHYTITYGSVILTLVGITMFLAKRKCKKQETRKNIELEDIITNNPLNSINIPNIESQVVSQTSENPRFFLKGGGVV